MVRTRTLALVTLAVALILGTLTVVASLTGWMTGAQLMGAPAPTFTPPAPARPVGTDEAAELARAAWSPLAGLSATEERPQWAHLAETSATWWQVLTGPDPLGRVRDDPTVLPGPPGAGDAEQASVAVTALAAYAWEQARTAPDGPTAAWWTGLAGSADQVKAGIGGAYLAPPPLDPLVTFAPKPALRAASDLLAAYHEACYEATALTGLLTPGSEYAATLRAVTQQLRSGRDALVALVETQHWPSVAPAPAYVVPPVSSDADVLAALGQVNRDLSQAALIWLAAAPTQRTAAIAQLQALTGLGLGYASSYWFGWPD